MSQSPGDKNDDAADMAKALNAMRYKPLAVVCKFCEADLTRGASMAKPDHGNHLADCPVWKAAELVRAARSKGVAVSHVAAPTNEPTYRNALDRAAYALFQLKRFANMPPAAIEFCREQHAEACKVLDDLSGPITQKPGELATGPKPDTLGSGLTGRRDAHQSAPSSTAPIGTFACRLCGVDHPHQHDHAEENVLRLGCKPVSHWTDDDKQRFFGMLLYYVRNAKALVAPSATALIEPPSKGEIAAYRDLFRKELDKNMEAAFCGSPSTEAHAVALRRFVEVRNKAAKPGTATPMTPIEPWLPLERFAPITNALVLRVADYPVKAAEKVQGEVKQLRAGIDALFEAVREVGHLSVKFEQLLRRVMVCDRNANILNGARELRAEIDAAIKATDGGAKNG